MLRRSRVLLAAALIALASCGGSSKSSRDGTSGDDIPLPAECTLAPYTAHVVRDGGLPAGSATYNVIGAAAIQTPLVPDRDQVLTYQQSKQMGETTDLVGYALLFGDEQFGVDDVSLFSGYTPEAAGKSRGVVSIYPSTLTPLAVGDVVTSMPMDEVGLFTTLNNLGMDFKATPDEYMGYTNSIRGRVTILGLNDEAICLDVDLSWDVSDLTTSSSGTLVLRGVFTAPLTERTLPLG